MVVSIYLDVIKLTCDDVCSPSRTGLKYSSLLTGIPHLVEKKSP